MVRRSVGLLNSEATLVRARGWVGFVCGMLGVVSLTVACSSAKSDDAPPDGTPGGKLTVPVGTKCTADDACGGGRCVQSGCVPGLACKEDSVCQGARCVDGGCVPKSATDGAKDGDETDVDCGGAVAPRCDDGKACVAGTDCGHLVCAGGLCAAPTTSDGVQNGEETDVDCGGGTGVLCAAGKKCDLPLDCDSRFCTAKACEPRMAGRLDGDESDVDCGGTVAPACDWFQSCNVDKDCSSNACGPDNKCLVAPSCKTQFGGTTCGYGGDADAFASHETCCKTLEVPGFSDATHPGKKVFLDKYEITAGRLRVFIESVMKANGGEPNLQGYMAAHRPASKWNNAWENELPQSMTGGSASYTVTNPTSNLLYPGQDVYSAPATQSLQGTWSVKSGAYTVSTGLAMALGDPHSFPEAYSDPQIWKQYTGGDLDAASHYAATHALNCGNQASSQGMGTYWFDAATIAASGGGIGKFWSQQVLDEKSTNCTPNAILAAFCAWDGGQLETAEVYDYVAPASAIAIGKRDTAPANKPCLDNAVNSVSDSTQGCYADYSYDGDSPMMNDASAKIRPPGRYLADSVTVSGQADPWKDMIGNLVEAVTLANGNFAVRGYGVGYGSITNHRLQQTTPRYKSGSTGGRCMRFK